MKKSNVKSKTKEVKEIKKSKIKKDKIKDIKLDGEKIELVCLAIYSFFTTFVFIGLIHFMYISLGFAGFEMFYLVLFLSYVAFYWVGKKGIKFAFNY